MFAPRKLFPLSETFSLKQKHSLVSHSSAVLQGVNKKFINKILFFILFFYNFIREGVKVEKKKYDNYRAFFTGGRGVRGHYRILK